MHLKKVGKNTIENLDSTTNFFFFTSNFHTFRKIASRQKILRRVEALQH